ncbi:MAG: TlpA family protein disulfide reductase [Gammaproteobacteria bacterium]|nr:TlpA family protein disulfide reductase [Gammaproteobacteria bacterium]
MKLMIQNIIKNTFFVFLMSLMTAWPVSQAFANEPLFSDFNNKPHKLEEYFGHDRWTVFLIWASDCGICNKEVSNYIDFNFKHRDGLAQVIGISIDGQAKKTEAIKFIERHDVDFQNLLVEPDRMARWFEYLTGQNWVGTPTILIYTPEGELQAQQAGAVPVELLEKFIRRSAENNKARIKTTTVTH